MYCKVRNAVIQYITNLCYNRNIIKEELSMISALCVAKKIICRMNETGKEITQLKLQKLLYFTEAYYMATYNKSELFKEQFYAWTYGPVCKEVYIEYKMYLSSPIPASECENLPTFDNDVEESILMVCNVLGDLTSSQLIQLTHMQDSPWSKANSFKDERISKKDTREWFESVFNI